MILVNIPLGPNAGPLGRSPLGGRNWEGFTVDPYLSGKLNADTIVGYQDAGVIANLKVNNPLVKPQHLSKMAMTMSSYLPESS